MVLEWHEREHEEDNAMAENHPWALEVLSHPGHEGPSQTIRVLGLYVLPMILVIMMMY
jgi:hypothetical protein